MVTPHSSTALTGRGKIILWLASISASVAWISGDENARLATAILAAPIFVDFVAKQRRLHLTSVSIAPRRTVAGSFFIEHVQIEHRGNRPLRNCCLYEPLLMHNEPAVLLPTLKPFETHCIALREHSLNRSYSIQRVIVLESQWPLGIFATSSVVTTECELVTEPIRAALNVDFQNRSAATQTTSVDREKTGPEFYELREHLTGNDIRSVHALRSAALGTLVGRVSREPTAQTTGVILDLRQQPGQPEHQGDRQLESSLRACAALTEQLLQRGSAQRVLVIDTKPQLFDIDNSFELTGLMTLLSKASLSPHYAIEPSIFLRLESLSQCYWIAAGGYTRAPELLDTDKEITVIKEIREK